MTDDIELCDRDEDHGLATQQVRTHRGDVHSHPVFLCNACADRIDTRLVAEGMTVTIEDIGSDDG